MGYDITLSVETDNPNLDTREIALWMARKEAVAGDDLQQAAEDWRDMLEGGCGRWPNWTADLLALSRDYPTTLISAECHSEELGDHTVAYFLNGLCYSEKLMRPPFDRDRLAKPPEGLLL